MDVCSGLNGPSKFESLLVRVITVLMEEGALSTDPSQPIVHFKHPAQLNSECELQMLGTSLHEDQLDTVLRDVIRHSVRTQHPLFLNQLYGGLDPYGLAGAWITEALNTNHYTFEVAPMFVLIEMAVINRLLSVVGYEEGDGLLAPGGSMANMYAMVLARYKLCPEVKTAGLSNCTPLAVFVSSDGHYSLLKAAHWLGLGTDHVYEVATDAQGRMEPASLAALVRQAISAGKRPFFVCATAGTTVLGAFDPFNSIADICQQFDLWLHVDACWGGSLIFSQKYKFLLDGVERSHSIAWNPHKMLGAPLQCSIILLKDKDLLQKCNSTSATYLFQQDKFYDTKYDVGDKSVQCGRKPDAFKFWLMWRVRGDNGFASLIDNAMEKSRYFLKRIKNIDGFRLVLPDFQCTNICFWYIPKCLRHLPESDDWWVRVSKVAPLIKEKIVIKGSLLIAYQPLKHKNLCNFFRFVLTCHPEHSEADMDRVVEEIQAAGEHLIV